MHAVRHHNPQAWEERRDTLYDEDCLEYCSVRIKHMCLHLLTSLVVHTGELAIYLVSVMPTRSSYANLSPNAVMTS